MPLFILAYLLIPTSFFVLPKLLSPEPLIRLGKENGLFENIGGGAFLVSAVLFLLAFAQSANDSRFFGMATRRNIYLLLLALLMIVCFGEEISWGQAIRHWQTPTWLAQENAQSETNLHNLWAFHAKNPDGSRKSFRGLLLNANRLFALFWLVYCVLVPLLAKISVPARRFLHFAGVPIPPLAVGGLFLATYAAFHGAIAFLDLDIEIVSSLEELKEAGYAVAYGILAFYFLLPERAVPRWNFSFKSRRRS